MSDRITWEPCPRCGGLAAAGWAAVTSGAGQAEDRLVEFDCPAGCISLPSTPPAFGETWPPTT
jgi:hypothetical protein